MRRERFEGRQQGESLPRQLLVTLGDSVADKISSALSGALAGLLAGALGESPSNPCLKVSRGYLGVGLVMGRKPQPRPQAKRLLALKGMQMLTVR